MKALISNGGVGNEDTFFEMFEDGGIRSDVYMNIEQEAENEEDEGIYNKLIFDAVNESIEALKELKDNSRDLPWIRKRGPPKLSQNFEKLTTSLLKIIDEKVHKFDDLDADPKRARRFADLGFEAEHLSTIPLTAQERLDTVLTAEALEINQKWNDDYEIVEASVKTEIADMILEELLYDTTYHVHLVKGDD